MRHGKYIGPRADLRFIGALVRPDPRSKRHVLVQMDRVRVNGERCGPDDLQIEADEVAPELFGWHRFKRSDFRIGPASMSQCHERQAWNRFYRAMSRAMPGHTEQEATERGL